MRLEAFHEIEKIYIDSAIFISHHSIDSKDRKECTAFLNSVENGEVNAITSSIAIDETVYILLKFKAAEILDTDRHYKILDALRHDKNVFDEAWKVAQDHIDYMDALRKKNSLHIINIKRRELNFENQGLIHNSPLCVFLKYNYQNKRVDQMEKSAPASSS